MRFKVTRFADLQQQPPEPRQVRGAGDLVARVFKPIAKALDRTLGTRLADCKSCEERQAWANKIFPFGH